MLDLADNIYYTTLRRSQFASNLAIATHVLKERCAEYEAMK